MYLFNTCLLPRFSDESTLDGALFGGNGAGRLILSEELFRRGGRFGTKKFH